MLSLCELIFYCIVVLMFDYGDDGGFGVVLNWLMEVEVAVVLLFW